VGVLLKKYQIIISIVAQSLGIAVLVAGILYYPVNAKLDKINVEVDAKFDKHCIKTNSEITAISTKVDGIKTRHDEDCVRLIEESKKLKDDINLKVSEKELHLIINPLIEKIESLGKQIKEQQREIIELIVKNNKP